MKAVNKQVNEPGFESHGYSVNNSWYKWFALYPTTTYRQAVTEYSWNKCTFNEYQKRRI